MESHVGGRAGTLAGQLSSEPDRVRTHHPAGSTAYQAMETVSACAERYVFYFYYYFFLSVANMWVGAYLYNASVALY